jgi:AP2-like factor (ANT lineage)
MPLNSDGSLCIVEALHRSEQERHGNKLAPQPMIQWHCF